MDQHTSAEPAESADRIGNPTWNLLTALTMTDMLRLIKCQTQRPGMRAMPGQGLVTSDALHQALIQRKSRDFGRVISY